MGIHYADTIIRSVTMPQVCSLYGIEVNRAGFCSCPFHSEKTASMRIYSGDKGFYCFGCHEGGNVIDFIEKYFGLEFMDAVKKINSDFNLGLPIGEPPTLRQKNQISQQVQQASLEKARKGALEKNYEMALNNYIRLDRQIRENRPGSPEDEPNQLFIEAVQNIGWAEYKLEIMEGRLLEHGNER